ncbi:unnamed protein product [Closterium sp. Yama58-4]|nr:unnamed protein product [Closterium sp. Yama58-4]
MAMATCEKSSTTSSLLSSPSSFSCRSPALQQSFGAASPSLSPCPSLNLSSVIVILPDNSVRLYEQRISVDRVLAEFPNHELRHAGSRKSLDANSHLSSLETYAASISDAWSAQQDVAARQHISACGGGSYGGVTAPGESSGFDFATAADSHEESPSQCYTAARAARLHSVAPLLRQSSLTTYLPSTAAAIAESGGFQPAEAASMMMRHGAHAAAAAAALTRFPGPMMLAYFDSLDPRELDEATSKAPAAGALGHCVQPAFAQSFHDTGGSELLRQSEVYFDGKMDAAAASADVPTPRLPCRRPLDGTAALAARAAERHAGDTSKCGANAITSAVSSVDGDKQGAADESLGAAASALQPAAASDARPGFAWQFATSTCLNLPSPNITADGSRDGSAGGGSSGEENPERLYAIGGRAAGTSLFEDWTDLRGRRPRVAAGSSTALGKEASGTATERRRPIFHQKTPSGRILQELFDLESGPLDLEFLVSLRTLSRSSSTRSSSARSSSHARDTPTATPSRPPSSLVTASPAADAAPPPPLPPPSPPLPPPAAALEDRALSGAASASTPLGSGAPTEPTVSGAASSPSHVPQSSALVSATPAAPTEDGGIDDDSSIDEEDEAAAAAASAWAAVELVDGSVLPAASVSRGWIASAVRSRFISRIASSFNYSSLHGRRVTPHHRCTYLHSIPSSTTPNTHPPPSPCPSPRPSPALSPELPSDTPPLPTPAVPLPAVPPPPDPDLLPACWTLPLPAPPPPPDLDLLDPCPDITALFRHYNDLYFHGRLGACLVEWSSKRMTLCAGVCMYDGALCRIRLSAPLLQYRPVSDLKATLLHEMIHAFIFLCRPSHSREDHGPMFQGIMGTINSSTLHDHQRPPGGYQISIYHSFKDEVNVHRRHAWQCARCQEEVRRAMNRPPSVADCMALRQPYTTEGRGGSGQGGSGQGRRGQGGHGGTMTADEKERERQRRIATCRHPRCNWHLLPPHAHLRAGMRAHVGARS